VPPHSRSARFKFSFVDLVL